MKNKKSLLICFTLIASLSFLTKKASSKEHVLENFIDEDRTLERGIYIIENNVKVGKKATLTVSAGCQLLFRKGASMRIDGGLFLDGKTNSFIEIKSENTDMEGFGLVISGSNRNASIRINFTKFSFLLVPLNFEKNWSRKEVSVENNIFENIVTGESGIIVKNPDEISSSEEIPFSFSRNNFVENNSSIYIESMESDVLNMKIEYNLATLNYYFGYEVGGGLNSPFSVVYDQNNLKFKVSFKGNSIFDNFLLHNTNDTIVQPINVGVRGRSEKLDLNNNYYGPNSSSEIQRSFDHFNNNPSAPYILADQTLPSPSDSTHGHIWNIVFNHDTLQGKQLPLIQEQALEISVSCNRSLLVREGVTYVFYSYYDETTSKVVTKKLASGVRLEKENKTLRFIIKDDVYLKNIYGYFSIDGLRDNEGFEIPKVMLGHEQLKKYFINNNFNIKL